MTALELEASPADWDSRALCPDESCIGVLNAEARCGVCGRQGEVRSERAVHFGAAHSDEDDGPATDAEDDVTAHAAASSVSQDGAAVDPEFADRELCPDESCIGVLDDAGACKVCGKRQ